MDSIKITKAYYLKMKKYKITKGKDTWFMLVESIEVLRDIIEDGCEIEEVKWK